MTVEPILLAGDRFVLNRLLAAELAPGAWDVRALELPWPHVPFGRVAEVDEASDVEDELIEALQGVRVCLTQMAPLTQRVLAACSDLELFAVSRGGPVNANLAAATEHGVAVTFAPGRNAESTAEHTIGMMLAAMRRIPVAHNSVVAGRWESGMFAYEETGLEVAGSTVGLVGAGAIGSRVATVLRAMGATVLVSDPYAGVESVPLDDLLRRSTVVSLHARLTDETRGMIGERELALMPAGSVLVNCARGGLLDYHALAKSLTDGHLFGAALDVYDEEPLPADHPLRDAPNVVMTPHLAGASRAVAANAARMVGVEAARWLAGEPPLHCANPEVLK
jgi:D-3-phosphoglycerate dehydrogenase / 2-oxoglutarate reductase